MPTEKEVREQLANYLAGEMGLDSFDDWLTRETWDIHQSDDEAAQRLVYEIELSLAEHSSGHMDDARLNEKLGGLLGRYAATIDAPTPVTVQMTSAVTHHGPIRVRLAA